ncbi:unnamed protein product [Adineta ricciae]|uniref:Uncharacterized protein n=1 Tax=Adineta ricciae TaxID=249248 RepID=A0A814IW80_ADIRI|nr:unnamed protein product [Adineta ricciae]CAF1506777.1 unnamed protein product [Adineta ricciae]
MFHFNSIRYLFSIIIIFNEHLLPLCSGNTNSFGSNRIQYRQRRSLWNFFSDTNEHRHQTGNNSPIFNVASGNDASSTTKTVADSWLKMVKEQSGRIMEGATDVALTPVHWMQNISSYWPIYVICATIILILGTYIYCVCQNKMANLMFWNSAQYHRPAQNNNLSQFSNPEKGIMMLSP